MGRKDAVATWAGAWLEKMSIVTIFNGLFNYSDLSFWIGLLCAAGSLILALDKAKGE